MNIALTKDSEPASEIIRLVKVSKVFRKNPVLKGVDLSINRGERIALVGSNGAGKTTLIRCLLGEYTYDGSVSVNGRTPRAHRHEVLARVGFVPQLPPPLKMPVGQLINFAAHLCGSDPKRMHHVASQLGLDTRQIRNQPFVKLSGGQKQKLLIGIALGRDSDILIMDEPAANLDPEARHRFFELLAERQGDAVMLISSHRLDEVAYLVNRVIELDQGKVVLDDRVAENVGLGSVMTCRLGLTRSDAAISRALMEWRFHDQGNGILWEGVVAGPDRLRFLGVLSRYAGLLASVSLENGANQNTEVLSGESFEVGGH